MNEYLDYYDDKLNYIGKATREEIHKKGLWHQTFHCWIVRNIHDGKYVLLQRRGPEKKTYPNTLDITAAGHLTAGETRIDGLRELNEELGINAKENNLIYLGIRMSSAKVGETLNQEFAHVHLLEWDIELSEYNLQFDEVSGLVEMKLEEGLKLFSNEVDTVPIRGYQRDKNGALNWIEININKFDIIPRIDPYYYKIFIMAERYFDKKKYLSI